MRDDFEREIYGTQHLDYDDVQKIVSKKLLGSLAWMIFGLAITGIVGFFVTTNDTVQMTVINLFTPLMFLELAVVFIFSMMAYKASVMAVRAMFILYAALNGLTLSILGLIYTGESLTYIFLGTVVYFSCLALYGYITKEDLSKYQTFVFGALIALIIVSVVNMFMKSGPLEYMLSYAGVLIFSAFTAIDVNRIKKNLTEYALEDSSILNRIQIVGALNLYLDFVNLFLYLLRIFGKKR
ncbi:MAG: Bax inhibitor-1/YccA family protein [Sebaldella sp.]|nr:Bax inhibitor-1/YccA family protein [Sebaldella sp.]